MSLNPLDIREWVQSQLPKNDSLGFSNYLLDSLKELLSTHSGSLESVKNQLEEVYEELEFFKPFLKDVAEQGNNGHDELIQNFAERIIGKAYEVEYIIDSLVVGDVLVTDLTAWLLEIIQEIELIKIDLTKYREKKLKSVSRASNEELVGMEDVRETIVLQLVRGTENLDVVSIIGTAGSGKTSVARSIKNDQQIVSHFDFLAECRVSQEYTRRDVLLSILSYIPYYDELSKLGQINDDDLADMLRRYLIGKRYLLVIDDVWGLNAWEDLRLCFPDARNYSRIILTTRLKEVAVYAGPSVTQPNCLRYLSLHESWILLQKKVFGDEICPIELRVVGEEIAKKCEGLPLSIVSAAALLIRTDKTEKCWRRILSRFGELIQQAYAKEVVKLIYNDLPDTLKPCFLYFGALEDNEISISKLTRLWIEEGFIQNEGVKCLEDIAEWYLEDLIGRDLVMVTKRSIDKIKACRLRDLLLEFCKAKAKENNFLVRIKRKDVANPPHSFSEKLSHRRLLFCSNGDDLAGWRPSCSHTRSILFREVKDETLCLMGDASVIFGSLKFLRVLDLESFVVKSCPTELNHLRYLAFRTTEESIPSSIEHLSNLQTFIVTTEGQQVKLPPTFWKLVRLRHVSIGNRALINLLDAQEASNLESLATLSSPYISRAEDMEKILSRTPNIRTLKCEFADSWGWEKNEQRFPELESFPQLETLKVMFFKIPKIGPSGLNFPLNLKKLTLWNFPLPLVEISAITNLVSLEVLKLQGVSFEGDEWEVTDYYAFPRLKLLKLENVRLSNWIASSEAFERLEKLVLKRCLLLEGIPDCFADIGSLKWIEVNSCNQSVVDSAMAIQRVQVDDYRSPTFRLYINDEATNLEH